MKMYQCDGDTHMPFVAENATVIANMPVTEQHATRQYIRNCRNGATNDLSDIAHTDAGVSECELIDISDVARTATGVSKFPMRHKQMIKPTKYHK